ncbi:hypothetical protein SDC9_114959 [bioreactor metagenome]|uniref:Mor transcription activator family protein n=2 Tax=root TaxID=1 RepID=A0A1G9T877_9FIRM|nr:Mor transcription activator family protein [Romboutsia lituseburensis]CEH36181.1 Homeodomain-like [Romboutsia lituseburensis]SDM43856.1 Mor transcription activator family protein [Romboutsia lituseburensis DSM 797]
MKFDNFRYNVTLSDIPEAYQDIASMMGIDKFIEFCYLYGGGNIYFPTVKTLKNHFRNDEILELYRDGMAIVEIARKHQISPNYVRYIVKRSADLINYNS